MLKGTPFHARTSALCQASNWRRWAGHIVASSYELQHDREYWAIRTAAALIDVSPLYKYLISGTDAERLMNRVVTRDVVRCAVGQVMNSVGLDVSVEDISAATAALAIQGPSSRTILNSLSDTGLEGLRFFRQISTRLAGIPVWVSRTGYTGDLGYEIWVDAGDALPLWDVVVAAGEPHGLLAAGMLALDMARIEAGLLLIAVDYVSVREALIEARESSPFELGLGWTVSLDKGFFVGRDALRREKEIGSEWMLRGLEVDWEGLEHVYGEMDLPPELPVHAWRTSVPVYAKGRQVGYATSGCWSPLLKKYIALAHLRSTWARPDTAVEMEVTVEHERQRAPATVVPMPFFDPERKKA
jgi:aminomethyltransferase